MKYYKNLNSLIALVLFFLVFSACSTYKPINRIDARKHGGAANQHLTIQQKNDIEASVTIMNTVNIGTEDNDNTGKINLNGFQGTLNYGLTNNLALSSSINSMNYKSKFDTKLARNRGDSYPVETYEAKAKSKDYKVGLHYYLIDSLNKENRWQASQFYGITLGTGSTTSNGDLHRLTFEDGEERAWIRGVHDSNYYQISLHTNHSLMSNVFDLSVGNNLSMLRNNLKDGQLSKGESTTSFLWQPSVRASLGYKTVKLFTQLDWTKPLNNQFFESDIYRYYTVGLQIKLNTNKL